MRHADLGIHVVQCSASDFVTHGAKSGRLTSGERSRSAWFTGPSPERLIYEELCERGLMVLHKPKDRIVLTGKEPEVLPPPAVLGPFVTWKDRVLRLDWEPYSERVATELEQRMLKKKKPWTFIGIDWGDQVRLLGSPALYRQHYLGEFTAPIPVKHVELDKSSRKLSVTWRGSDPSWGELKK